MEHTPVLLNESIDGLDIRPDGIYVDGTLGRGGHSIEIVKRLDAGRLIAIDRDADAIHAAGKLFSDHRDRISFVRGNFKNLSEILDSEGVAAADGMLFDLGVSSPQLDNTERGFSYMHDAPLDMRMDTRASLTAFDIVNKWQEDELRKVFYEYGEERYAARIARVIVKKRGSGQIKTTFDLNEIIVSAMPAAARREQQHPSKRCYMALRIAVNDELGAISEMLNAAPQRLKPGGRLCVISFHSLEDRIVKNSFAARVSGCLCPRDFPVCVCGFLPTMKLITKKPVTPTKTETDINPRARSAKLRIAEKI